MAVHGYARVSTDGQTLDAQVAALRAAAQRRSTARSCHAQKRTERRYHESRRSGERRRSAGHSPGQARQEHQGPAAGNFENAAKL
jgi:DNA invertase Pin-like site-specific DNA recombinase